MILANEPVRPEPLAYFLTWTTYGTWLPGDQRGWTSESMGGQPPDFPLRRDAAARMKEEACWLDLEERKTVEATIADHCRVRGWELLAVNCRTNHVHVVVRADVHPDEVRTQFKSWSTRRLREFEACRGLPMVARK